MKRMVVCLAILMLCVSGVAFALLDTTTNNNQHDNPVATSSSTATGGSVTGSGNSHNSNSNRNTNSNKNQQGQAQGQLQGQIGIVDVKDNSSYESKAYSFAPPALGANKGINEGNIYSVFGGIGLSEDSEYVLAIEKLAVIERLEKSGYITREEAVTEARSCLIQLKDSTKPKRILGFGPKTRGRHLLNLFGLIAFDSYVNEDKVNTRILQKEIESKMMKEEALVKTVDEDLTTGNRGNVNQ